MSQTNGGPAAGLQRWRIETNVASAGGLQLSAPHQIALPFAPARMARTRDDRTLAVVSENANQSVLLDLVTETISGPALPHFNACYVALSPDGERLATSGWHSDRVKLWDRTSGRLLRELEVGLTASIFLTPANLELIVAREKEFTFLNLATMEVTMSTWLTFRHRLAQASTITCTESPLTAELPGR